MRILTINAEDWYNGYVSPQDRDWERFEYRVEKGAYRKWKRLLDEFYKISY